MFRYNQTKYRGRWSQNVLLNRPLSTAEPVTASGHARRQNFCTAQTTAATSFDHLVGAGEQRRRHVERERLCGGQIDDELELGRLLDWNIGRLCSAQHLVDDLGGASPSVGEVWPIRHQCPGFDILAGIEARRQTRGQGKRDNARAPRGYEGGEHDVQRVRLVLEPLEGWCNFLGAADFKSCDGDV